MSDASLQLVKCACRTCQCKVSSNKGVVRDGKVFCSETCAYDCTETTCVCVHDRCGEKKPR
ncbi:MAG TPA: metallothionein [Tepidisphaeraceae bacterium]|nr:metallothionein [Tepidisphaeraceae bacterium]